MEISQNFVAFSEYMNFNHFKDLNFVPFLITGAASLNAKMNGMIAMRTIIYFLVTSLLSAIIGLILVLLIHPGNPETKAELGNGSGKIGEVLSNKLEIACGNNQSIKILEIQREGKNSQKIGDFMLGSQIKKGSILSNA